MTDKSIFITGAAAGIGQATARLFHARGFTVGLYDVDADGVAKLADELGDRTVHGALDVTDADAFAAATHAFTAQVGRLDVLHNNAGVLKMGRFDQLQLSDHHRTVQINVGGVINGVAAALPHLRATAADHGRACIVNMCSASALHGVPELSSYSATKFAVRGLTEALHIEFEREAIHVTAVLPSFVSTGMVNDQAHQSPLVEKLGVPHTAEDVAQLVYRAAHGNRVLWYGTVGLAAGDRLGHLAPGIMRAVMRRGNSD